MQERKWLLDYEYQWISIKYCIICFVAWKKCFWKCLIKHQKKTNNQWLWWPKSSSYHHDHKEDADSIYHIYNSTHIPMSSNDLVTDLRIYLDFIWSHQLQIDKCKETRAKSRSIWHSTYNVLHSTRILMPKPVLVTDKLRLTK